MPIWPAETQVLVISSPDASQAGTDLKIYQSQPWTEASRTPGADGSFRATPMTLSPVASGVISSSPQPPLPLWAEVLNLFQKTSQEEYHRAWNLSGPGQEPNVLWPHGRLPSTTHQLSPSLPFVRLHPVHPGPCVTGGSFLEHPEHRLRCPAWV